MLLGISLAATLLGGCTAFDARPAADAGFSPNRPPGKHSTRAAFLQHVWVDTRYRDRPIDERFHAVYVAPVDTRFLRQASWWQSQTAKTKAELEADTERMAKRMRKEIQKTIANYPGRRIQLAQQPGPGVLSLELAITELVPSKAFWNASATAAGFVVPGAGMLSVFGNGSIAIEGRAREDVSNEVIATFRDREADKMAPVNVAGYTWYRGAEVNIEEWGQQIAELLNTPPSHVVKDASPVTLKPW